MKNRPYSKEIESFPIYPHLDDICESVKKSKSHFLVLTAETAAGKSTALPLALLNNFNGKILMLEPRRLAVLNIASRVSSLLEEDVGKTCGYVMHLETRKSEETRFEVLTDAVLVRMIQEDPSLEGVSVVVLDEFHERSVSGDLCLAFLKEAMALRDDLYVVIMSATMDTKKICNYIGDDCPVYNVKGRQFPVETIYKNVEVEKAVRDEVNLMLMGSTPRKSILVFLPGIKEIRRAQENLEAGGIDTDDVELLVLHSSVTFEEQKKVLQPQKNSNGEAQGRIRVILSSAIAETSLTVPDVGVVIDSGLSRLNVYNVALGMDSLVTQSETEFNASQRAGRAGRVADGRCIRLWSQIDARLPVLDAEILRTDLSSLVLECALWGVTDRAGLEWLDMPPEPGWNKAVDLLQQLHCIDDEGHITLLGETCLTLGVHPRVACVAISGYLQGQEKLSTRLAIEYSSQGQMSPETAKLQALDLLRRVQKSGRKDQLSKFFPQEFTEFSTGYALLCGYPDRFARRQSDGQYQFASGRVARLSDDVKFEKEYIVATVVNAGDRSGMIYKYAALSDDVAADFIKAHVKTVTEVSFEEGSARLQKFSKEMVGRIVIVSRRLSVDDSDYLDAVINEVQRKGLSFLPLSDKTSAFLLRVEFYIENGDSKGAAYDNRCSVDVEEEKQKLDNLALDCREWLSPFMSGVKKVTEDIIYDALYWYLSGSEIDKTVPEVYLLPNGKKRRLVYEKQNGKVVVSLEVIIQQIFGCFENPKVMGCPVILKLLSPARRPLQITTDLDNFWTTTWPEICSEMKGRYPKHNWDYRVVTSDKD